MLIRIATAAFLSNSYSTSSQKWREAIQSKQLVSQISTLLLQRTNWSALLPRHLPLTPSLLRRILHRTRSHPKLSLSFFHFATSSFPCLRPDLSTIAGLISLLVRSNLTQPAHSLLKPLVPPVPVAALVDATLEDAAADEGKILDFLLRIYSERGLLRESLYLLGITRLRGPPLVGGSNALLVALCRSSDAGLVWPCYGLLLRSGVVPDSAMWSTLARVLCREGKLGRSLVLLKSRNSSIDMYDLLIECASSNGDLVLAVELLNAMESKGFVPSISTYSSIFDGACKFGDSCLTNIMLSRMIENRLLPTMPFTDYDLVIEKFCRLKKSYAVGMLYEKCRVKMINLRPSSYVRIMQIFCEEGRKDEAIGVYELIHRKGIRLSLESYNALWSILFRGAKFEEIGYLIKDALKRGLTPNVSDLSRYYGCLCGEGKWDQAADLLTMVLDNGFLPHGLDCSSLVEYYCYNKQVYVALSLHHKFEKLGGSLDVSSYNTILERLTAEKRTKEAVQMFDYMRLKDTGSTTSFVLIIAALCCERDMRKAMIVHDEMVKKGLKPDDDAYKCLIAGFC